MVIDDRNPGLASAIYNYGLDTVQHRFFCFKYGSKMSHARRLMVQFFLWFPFFISAHADDVIQRVTDSSVKIRVELLHGFAEDEMSSGRWHGSGFVIDRDTGWIMTNAHVAGSGPAEITVQFADDSTRHPAERVFVDSRHDIAVIATDPAKIPAETTDLQVDCSYVLERGTEVVSVGHPEGHDFTVTLGVLSGIRTFDADPELYSTDVVVESGSSGGPVVSRETGKVLGIATSAYDDSDIGLLTPAREACQVSKLLMRGLDPSRPKLGFQMLYAEGQQTEEVGQIFVDGLPVEIGDRIIAIDDTIWKPERDGDLEDNLRKYQSGKVPMTVERDGAKIDVLLDNIKLGSLHERDWLHFSGLTFGEAKHQDSGYRNGRLRGSVIRVQSIDDSYFDISDLGFTDYGVLLSADGEVFDTLSDFYQFLETRQGDSVRLVVRDWDLTDEWVGYPFAHEISVEDLSSSFDEEL